MTNFDEYATEELEEEIELRKRKKTKIIQPLHSPDFGGLTNTLSEYISYVSSEKYFEENDWKEWIFESAIEAVYGKRFWTWKSSLGIE